MRLSDLKGKHDGQEIICIGAGPSLKNVPPAFLESRTNIAVNYVHHYYPWLRLDYWTALDPRSLNALIEMQSTLKFIPERMRERAIEQNVVEDDLCFFKIDQEIPGIRHDRINGPNFKSTLILAAWLAWWMGASDILVVGFDCTNGPKGPGQSTAEDWGIIDGPHFYDPDKDGVYFEHWDKQFRALYEFTVLPENRNVPIHNLSHPTMAKGLFQAHYSDYWSEKS